MAITYNAGTNTITVTGYTEGTPCNFTDIYNADKAGTLSLHARTSITGTDGAAVAVDRAERPADYVVLGGATNDLYITIANWIGTTATIRITGTDRDGAVQTEDIVVTANGNYSTTKWFKTITHTQVTVFTATSFDYDLIQGQWGIIWKTDSSQFKFNCKIQIGDGSTTTYFGDKLKQIVFADGIVSGHSQRLIDVKDNAYLTFGELVDASLKLSQYGVQIIDLEDTYFTYLIRDADTSTCQVRLYSSSMYRTSAGYQLAAIRVGNLAPIYNCKFEQCILHTCTMDLYNHSNCRCEMMENPSASSIINEIFQYSAPRGVTIANNTAVTIKNVIIKDCTADIRARSFWISLSAYLINTDCNWIFSWSSAATLTVYRQYEFDLKVQDKDENAIPGAAVKIWDKDNNLIVDTTTNASGVIATQTLNYGYYSQAGGNTPTMQTPHTIQISKPGYETYEKKWIIDKKTDWTIALHIPKRRFDPLEG